MSGLIGELEQLRDLLWESLLEADAEKRAALAREHRATVERIEALSGKAGAGDPIDELASRRASRAAGSGEGSRRARRPRS